MDGDNLRYDGEKTLVIEKMLPLLVYFDVAVTNDEVEKTAVERNPQDPDYNNTLINLVFERLKNALVERYKEYDISSAIRYEVDGPRSRFYLGEEPVWIGNDVYAAIGHLVLEKSGLNPLLDDFRIFPEWDLDDMRLKPETTGRDAPETFVILTFEMLKRAIAARFPFQSPYMEFRTHVDRTKASMTINGMTIKKPRDVDVVVDRIKKFRKSEMPNYATWYASVVLDSLICDVRAFLMERVIEITGIECPRSPAGVPDFSSLAPNELESVLEAMRPENDLSSVSSEMIQAVEDFLRYAIEEFSVKSVDELLPDIYFDEIARNHVIPLMREFEGMKKNYESSISSPCSYEDGHKTVYIGYIITEEGSIYAQIPDDGEWGFAVVDDDQQWPGGFGVAHSWDAVADNDDRITDEDRCRLQRIIDEARSKEVNRHSEIGR